MANREQLIQELQEQGEEIFDLDAQPEIKHNWVDRGLKMSCESPDHPHHVVWKRR